MVDTFPLRLIEASSVLTEQISSLKIGEHSGAARSRDLTMRVKWLNNHHIFNNWAVVRNQTCFSDFTLLGFSGRQVFLSFLIVVTYLMILVGNLTIFSIIKIDSHLQTPMYFFLSYLSILDVCYSTVTLPSMLANAVTGNRRISFNRCFTQLYFFVSLGGAECLLLAAMAYDRYVAICNPLHYHLVMNKMFCSYLVGGSGLCGFLNSVLHTLMTSKLTFCGARHINHFFCDVPPMLHASCTDTRTSQLLLYIVSVYLGMTPFVFVIVSYTQIISTILKIRSADGRRKAFSTCSAHLIVVTVFYVTANFNYIGPAPGDSFDFIKLSSVLYSVLTPLFNPVIYCLRNQEVQRALKKVFIGKHLKI
ncbi:olfactory receptor 5V1-like [Pseudophryne corroboree]|uniref:olfactory receptor 5V1-like n=1 Tax=Pseudophryne corroboree TaxID=495146 RepID=UPI00308197D2